MVKNLWHTKFNAGDEFITRRDLGDLVAGQPIDKDAFTERRLRQLYDQRVIVNADVWAQYVGEPKTLDEAFEMLGIESMNFDIGGGEDGPVVTLKEVITLPGVVSEIDLLRKDAEEIGIKVDKRWSVKRLNEEIEKALNGKPA